jgi:hypothetical protein
LWTFTDDGLIQSKLNGFVLDIAGGSTAPGAAIIAFPKNGANGTPNQKWTLGAGGLLVSQLDNFVVDIAGGSTAPGAPIIAFPKNGAGGTANQLWTLTW